MILGQRTHQAPTAKGFRGDIGMIGGKNGYPHVDLVGEHQFDQILLRGDAHLYMNFGAVSPKGGNGGRHQRNAKAGIAGNTQSPDPAFGEILCQIVNHFDVVIDLLDLGIEGFGFVGGV